VGKGPKQKEPEGRVKKKGKGYKRTMGGDGDRWGISRETAGKVQTQTMVRGL